MKILTILLGIIVSSSVFADGEQSVTARMTCADIQAQISELSAVEEPDEDVIDELTKLKADYRRSCSRSARGRKSSAGARVVIETVLADESAENLDAKDNNLLEEKSDVQSDDAENLVTDMADEVVTDAESAEEVVAEEVSGPTEDELLEIELQNLDAGLCADGAQPNKYGCCGDELFKDLGNTVFACCPPDGGDCFPPIKQGE